MTSRRTSHRAGFGCLFHSNAPWGKSCSIGRTISPPTGARYAARFGSVLRRSTLICALEFWEPILPGSARQDISLACRPPRICYALSTGFRQTALRCVVLGQDSYPSPEFATGRAFEAGNVASWRELDKMFSKSVRAFTQQIVAARTGAPEYARSFEDWPKTLAAVETGVVAFDPPSRLAQRWVDDGVLLLNASLTLSRFRVDVDPHQARGHWPLWRPLMIAVLAPWSRAADPLAFIGFGDVAAETFARRPGIVRWKIATAAICVASCVIIPARADVVLALEQSHFSLCNATFGGDGAPSPSPGDNGPHGKAATISSLSARVPRAARSPIGSPPTAPIRCSCWKPAGKFATRCFVCQC